MIRRFAAHLLGRHVGRRAQDHARLGGVDDRAGIDADGRGLPFVVAADVRRLLLLPGF